MAGSDFGLTGRLPLRYGSSTVHGLLACASACSRHPCLRCAPDAAARNLPVAPYVYVAVFFLGHQVKIFTGRGLSYLAVLLSAASIAGAVGVAATGDLRLPSPVDARRGDAGKPVSARVSAEIALAGEAERRGDVAAALAHYRAAALVDPRVVDPRSPVFLGPGFESRLKGWIAARNNGGAGSAQARSDAAYLFRRMYGGCG